ncbi:MAG TPA: glycosyltransferase family 2 protein [Solirubrobacteraceae bacterium]|nr:glycosyltransferase family 2 protein [Solirubrobacteraceae bacterium]
MPRTHDDARPGWPGGDRRKAHDGYAYRRFGALAGPLSEPRENDYRVEFRRLGQWRPLRTGALVLLAFAFVSGFLAWLMLPSHWPHDGRAGALQIVSIVMAANSGVIGLLALINVATLCRASLAARDPIPVRAERGSRVAFLTTIVPDREPLAMVRRTLEAARLIRHTGVVDVWLLDEGDDPDVAELCDELGVHHFTRRGVKRWNRPAGPYKTKSKHGNYNSWLDAHGENYEFLISVDPDHVPFPSFCERFLGYFRDPDVAFVVGPQVYGNYSGFVTQAAESQQFLFHSLLQRAGNRSATPMLVGTNNAIRISALKEIGGLRDSITEDMATSLAFHTSRNSQTSGRWRSVYTPDLIAVGEGPTSFTDYFTQQWRWARGTDDTLLASFWRCAHRLSPRQLIHYALLMSYYPTTAVAWVLGVLNGALYLTLHTGGVVVPIHLWLMLYLDAAALQVGLYFWNRRHNVSPHERQGSSGMTGMFISMLSTPIYVSALFAAVRKRGGAFVVTSKGDSTQRDTLATFARHIRWGVVIALPMVASAALGGGDPWMYLWSSLGLAVCVLPIMIWRLEARRRGEQRSRARERRTVERHASERAHALPKGVEPA